MTHHTSRADASASIVARLRRRWAASPWTSLSLRALSVAAAIGAFAWIGHATAAPPNGRAALDQRLEPLDGGSLGASTTAPAPQSNDVPAVAPRPDPPRAPASVVTQVAGAAVSGLRATPQDPVYVNHASAEQLRRLPGAGPKRAEAIVLLRQKLGRFQRVEDLMRVKGIGRATIRKWRALVRLDAPVIPDAATTSDAGP